MASLPVADHESARGNDVTTGTSSHNKESPKFHNRSVMSEQPVAVLLLVARQPEEAPLAADRFVHIVHVLTTRVDVAQHAGEGAVLDVDAGGAGGLEDTAGEHAGALHSVGHVELVLGALGDGRRLAT